MRTTLEFQFPKRDMVDTDQWLCWIGGAAIGRFNSLSGTWLIQTIAWRDQCNWNRSFNSLSGTWLIQTSGVRT